MNGPKNFRHGHSRNNHEGRTHESMNEKLRGTIKLWKSDNGYGFISRTGQNDVFVHFTALKNLAERHSLEPGTEVEFEIVPGNQEGKVQAANVVVV